MAQNEFEKITKEIDNEISALKEYYKKNISQFNTIQNFYSISYTPTSETYMSDWYDITYPPNRLPILCMSSDDSTFYIPGTNAYWRVYWYADLNNNRFRVSVSLIDIDQSMWGKTYSTNLVITSTGTIAIEKE